MIKVVCDLCLNELYDAGGLIFSPPATEFELVCGKYHVCRTCWEKRLFPFIQKQRGFK